MRIAYLILAHDNPQHVRRMIRALREEWTEFYIHVDRKAPRGLFDDLRTEPQTHLIADRISACWGGYSLVQAALNLMTAAFNDKEDTDRFVLLSGADYPIRSNREIRRFFENNPAECIGRMKMPTPDGRKPLAWLETLYFEKARGNYMPVRVLLTQTNRFLARFYKRNYRPVLGDLVPYAGSQWWALSREAVSYILDFIPANRRLVRFYKRAHIPDEMFLPTILGNSPLSERITRSVTFADWSKGKSRNPGAISQEHIDRFADPEFELNDIEGRGPCLFARKFSPNDGALLDQIDAWRNDTSDTEQMAS